MSFRDDNAAYEAWLRTQCDVVEDDLEIKHEEMGERKFAFLRATYFRWARKIGDRCPSLLDAPSVIGVGDIHMENFGTWRDADGRLVWGVNDFDEAAKMPYLLDLVRLATSAHFSPGKKLDFAEIARAIRDGYRRGLETPRPALLDQHEEWMRPYALATDKCFADYWRKMDGLPAARPDAATKKLLSGQFPPGTEIRFHRRVAGLGSLGRPRFLAVAQVDGGYVLREAKAVVPSAWLWAHRRASGKSHVETLSAGPFRSPDPSFRVIDGFVIRRLAPDAGKIEINQPTGKEVSLLKMKLLDAMGRDLAAVHLASKIDPKTLARHLKARPKGWLRDAADSMAELVERDFRDWKRA